MPRDVITQFAKFLTIIAVITVVPGPDTVLVIRNTIHHGRGHGMRTAVGCAIGLSVWALAASAGVALVLSAFARLAGAIRLIGAVYLLATGARLLWSGLRREIMNRSGADDRPLLLPARRSPHGGFLQGLFTDLSNPKAAVFFTALLPQFVTGGKSAVVFVSTAVLGLVAAAAALVGLTAYSMLAARAGAHLEQTRFSAILDIAAGLALVGFGVDLLNRQLAQPIRPATVSR